MALYTVMERSYIGGKIVEAGEIVEYDGEASKNLKATTAKEAKKAEQAADAAQQAEDNHLV